MRFIVPFGAEGAADRAARALRVGDVENLPGRGAVAGLERANALAASGEPVLLLGTPTTHALLPARLGIEPHQGFAPLIGLGAAPNVLLVPRCLGVHSVEQLVDRARHEHLVYASAGEGQTIHVCAAYFCILAGVEMGHRAYDGGSATAYADFVAGRVHVYFDSLLGARERIAAGDALPLAVSSMGRSATLPQVPTLAECGFRDHALDVWLGVFAANGAPDVSHVVKDAALAARLSGLGLEGGPLAADALALQVKDSQARWRRASAAIA